MIHLDGVEVDEYNAYDVVDRQLRSGEFSGREDRTPLDWIVRAYDKALPAHPTVAAAIASALAERVGTSDVTSSLVARFFSARSNAEGGDRLVTEVVDHLDRYPWSTPDPVPGGVAETLRGSLLRAAAGWRTPSDELLAVLRREVCTPDGAWSLLAVLWPRDRSWVLANLDRILAAEPRGAFPAYLRLKLEGSPPADAIRTVLSKVSAVDVDSFDWAIGRDVSDAADAKALRALLASKPALPTS